MSVQILVLFAIVCCATFTSALVLPPKLSQFRLQSIPQLKVKANNLALVAYSAFIASTPTIASAEDGGGATAVLVPLVISLLTIGPFLYYQQ
jgi:hypothetical protein